jgi:hypothetical protein
LLYKKAADLNLQSATAPVIKSHGGIGSA